MQPFIEPPHEFPFQEFVNRLLKNRKHELILTRDEISTSSPCPHHISLFLRPRRSTQLLVYDYRMSLLRGSSRVVVFLKHSLRTPSSFAGSFFHAGRPPIRATMMQAVNASSPQFLLLVPSLDNEITTPGGKTISDARSSRGSATDEERVLLRTQRSR